MAEVSADAMPTAPKANYPTLKARVKHVSQHVVTSRWTPLQTSAQLRVLDVFQTVERPVMTRFRDQRRRAEAQAALAPLLKTLRRKLPRMAFPPNTRDAHFDYERLIDSSVSRHVAVSRRADHVTAIARCAADAGHARHQASQVGDGPGEGPARD